MSVLSRLFNKAAPPQSATDAMFEANNQSANVTADVTQGRASDVESSKIERPKAENIDVKTIDVEMLMSAAALSIDPATLQQAIAAIDNHAHLSKLAVHGASTAVRQLAAQAIHDPTQLRNLLKDVRGKDKNVYKIIREKCDALLANDKAAAETQEAIATLCTALERHIHVPFDNLFAPALEHLIGKWNAVATQAEPDIQMRANQAIDRCQKIIVEHTREMDAQAARAAAAASADANRQRTLAELREILTALYSQSTNEPLQSNQTMLEALAARWSEFARHKSASTNDQAMFVQLQKAIEELAALIAQHGTVAQLAEAMRNSAPDEATASQASIPQSKTLRSMLDATSLLGDAIPDDISEIISSANSALQTWEQARKDKQDSDANALRQLGGLIRKAMGALNAGNTRLAAGLRRAVEEKMQTLPHVPQHLTNQVQQLDEKLNLLQDWRSYAVAPKRIELIEHMEALIGLDENPQTLADQIKRLQDEWKAISKGTSSSGDDTDAEWQRFREAAQKAYAPCGEYFAAQAKQREGNLTKRKALLDRLTTFIAAQDWQTTDWREVARALRESKQQWRNHQFVERAANKPLQAQFDELTQQLESRLEAESASNTEAKKTLIARAQALLTNEDSRQAIDAVKQLQLKWATIGIVARDDDQKLWAEFRQHCDAVFAKRQQQYGEYVASLQEAKSKAIALCEEAEQLMTLSGAELVEGAKKISALNELFEALGELPKADARALQTRFERALAQCEKATTAQKARDKAQAWNTALNAGDKIRLYRLAVAQNNGEQESAKQTALAFIEGVSHWPKGVLQTLKNELANVNATDIPANENKLRTLCIRAEILTETPTPESDQTFRRNYQLKHLMKGLGHASASKQDELNAMVLEWIGIGAIGDAVYAELLERFMRCRSKA